MKKFTKYLVLILAVAALIVPMTFVSVSAEGETLPASNVYAKLFDFTKNNISRTSGTAGGAAAEDYLVSRFSEMGGFDKIEKIAFTAKSALDDSNVIASNVVAFKDAPDTDKAIIVFAYYDNIAEIKINGTAIGGDGAYASGTGIAVLLEVAERLKASALQTDVYFVAFGGGEHGALGAKAFISEFMNNDLKNVVLAVDLNMAVGGEFQYVYSDEVDTIHGKYFYDKADALGAGFEAVPSYKKQATAVVSADSSLPYYHIGISGHNVLFMERGVPSLKFLSLNWSDYTTSGVSEFSGKANVLATREDTLENLVLRFGGGAAGEKEINARLNAVASTIVAAVEGEDFAAVMQKSKDEGRPFASLFETDWDIIFFVIKIVLIIGGIVAISLLTAKYRKNHPPQNVVIIPTAPAAPQPDPFEELKDDPFDADKDDGKRGGSSGGGDIFDGFGF